jgi:hypothetical protein
MDTDTIIMVTTIIEVTIAKPIMAAYQVLPTG